MIFYVESNGRRLVALTGDARVLWDVDVVAAANINPDRGQPVIRDLRLDGNELWVTCGKSETLKVQVESGKTQYVGAD